ncbi:hypothetical protein OAE84_01030 [bacterium]|nr:hypothetical protein [bacterium]
MKMINLTKIRDFKRTLAAAAIGLAALVFAAPGQAMPHFVTFDFSGPGACSASIYDVAAKFSACNLKAEAKAAKRGAEANLAACDTKRVRWEKKSEKACCSDSLADPEAHEACLDALDTAVIDIAGSRSNSDTCAPAVASEYTPRGVITADCRDNHDVTTQMESACCNNVITSDGGSCTLKWVNTGPFCNSEICVCTSSLAQQMALDCLSTTLPDDQMDSTVESGE